MQEDIENKTVTLIIRSGKLTGRTLATAFSKFLRYSKNKLKEHRDVKPQGKQTVRELIAQNQGVEKTELTDKDELKSFERIARQYGVDYAIRKSCTPEGKQHYILFFKARDRSAIDQAMLAYSRDYITKNHPEHPAIEAVVNPHEELLPGRKKQRVRTKGYQR